MIIFLLFLLPIFNSLNIPHKSYIKKINNADFKVLEPLDFKNEKKNVLFFGGLNGYIPNDIYSDFLTNLVKNDICCYICNGDIENANELVDEIHNKDKGSINIVAHSSGATPALKVCEKNKHILNAIFFDPVDSSYFENLNLDAFELFKKFYLNKINYKIPYLENMYIIHADKSYKWNFFPPKIPFIPAFKLETKNIKFKTLFESANSFEFEMLSNHLENIKDSKTKITSINIEDFGHSDILDDKYANIAHNSFIEGTFDRDNSNLDNYRNSLAYLVLSAINNENNLETKLLVNSYFRKLNYNIKILN